jgi:hypothetical protein
VQPLMGSWVHVYVFISPHHDTAPPNVRLLVKLTESNSKLETIGRTQISDST